MIKSILLVNFCIGITAIAISFFIFRKFTLILAIGILIANISLVVNGVVTQIFIGNEKNRNTFIYILSVVLRIFLIAIVGYIVFTYNKYNLVAYLFGYSLNMVGIGAYSTKYNSIRKGE